MLRTAEVQEVFVHSKRRYNVVLFLIEFFYTAIIGQSAIDKQVSDPIVLTAEVDQILSLRQRIITEIQIGTRNR